MVGGGLVTGKWWLNYQSQKQAEKIVNVYISAFKKQDFSKMLEEVDKNSYSKQGMSKKQVLEKYQTVFSGISAHEIKVNKPKIKTIDKGYVAEYTATIYTNMGAIENLNYQLTLNKNKHEIKVDWQPQLIFPKMEVKDKVRVNEDPASRGEITDRFGEGLAVNKAFNQIGIIPEKLSTDSSKRAEEVQKIANNLQMKPKEIETILNQPWAKGNVFVPIKVDYENQFNPENETPGVTTQPKEIRYYPLKEAASHLVGYTGAVTGDDIKRNPLLDSNGIVGKSGLEYRLDKKLRGENGGKIVLLDGDGKLKQTLLTKKRKDGENIQLTIDNNLQNSAYDTLKNQKGATVLMDPKSGNLLSLASSPSFDPNKMSQGLSQKEYDAYVNNPELPFVSRFTTGYAPGSTFKTITAAIGLDTGVTTADKTRKINGLKWQKDSSWGNYFVTRVSDIPEVSMIDALVYSDNIYFAEEALEMGAKSYLNGLKAFVFDENLDLPLTMKKAQLSNKKITDSEILLADTAYGQGELMINPIQQAAMYSVFANQGTLVYPKLYSNQKTKQKKAVIKAESADIIQTALTQVIESPNGTAHSLDNSNRKLAAKTGTAEIKEKQDQKGIENSFLLAFDAAEHRYELVSVIEDAKPGVSSTNVNQEFIATIDDYLKLKP